jgi:hypothetical protein
MNPEYLSALAALAGAVVGGMTTLASTWLAQNAQARADQMAHHRKRREELYADFIDEATELYADALEHDKAELPRLLKLYALIGKMELLSSPKVLKMAQGIGHTIIQTYRGPKKTFNEIEGLLTSEAVKPVREFSEAARDELGISGPLF